MEYLLSGYEINEHGIYFSLSGYEYRVLINFNEIYDANGDYAKLFQMIKGEGVYSVSKKLEEMKLAPLHDSLNYLLCKETFDELTQVCFENVKVDDSGTKVSKAMREKIYKVLNEIKMLKNISIDIDAVIRGIERDLTGIKSICKLMIEIEKDDKQFESPFTNLILKDPKIPNEKEILFTYIILKHSLSFYQINIGPEILFEELLLQKTLIDIFKDAGRSVERIFEEASLIKALLSKHDITQSNDFFVKGKENIFVSELINNRDVSAYLLLNEFEKIIYFNKERFENIVNWIFILSFISKDLMQQKEATGHSKL